jgi:tetratricopeptide (TPR) repeat protein
VQYHALASEQALSRAAFNEALSLGRAGLAIVPELAVGAESRQREFGLLSTLVRAASAIEGYGSAQTAMGSRRMLEIARESGDETRLFTALYGMWMEHNIAARHREAMEVASQMAQAAERRNSQAALADALTAQGWTMFLTGHHGNALAALVRAIDICRDGAGRTSIDGNDPLVFSIVCAGVSAWMAGYPTQALSLSESAVKRACDLNQPLSMAFALLYQSWILSWRGELAATSDSCDQLEVLVENGGIESFLGLNRVNQGWVASMRDEHEQGIDLIRSGIAAWAPNVFTYHSAILAEALMRAGRYQEVSEVLSAARDHALRTREGHGETEIERIAGELLMRSDVTNNAMAEQHIRRAIAIAVGQGAKSWELRATMSLARLLRDTGRREEARSVLAEIYNWFTEGFDTLDLKEAKALLVELAM